MRAHVLLYFLCIVVLLVGNAGAATRFVYEDFEDQSFLDTFVSTAESYCATMNSCNDVVSTLPHTGNYCMRYDGVASTNSRINIGELSPYGGSGCGSFTEFTDHYTNDLVVRYHIKYASDFNWGSNCKKILRIKGSTYGANGYFTWSQYGTYANIFLGNEAYEYGEIDLRYEQYNPPEEEWIEIYVHLRFSEDTILVKATDSGGEHVIYDGVYFDTGGAGYDAQDAYYITLVGARCGTSEGGQGDIYIDNVEIWDNVPTQDGAAPSPTNLSSTNGITWVNHTWDAGSGNITDSYNVSVNSVWYNTSSNEYYNDTGLSAGTWSNITVYAFNNTDGISTGSVSQDVQTSQNDIILSTNQFAMCNAWNTPQTFTQIDTEVDNLVGMVWYNHTSGWWEAYMSGRSYNSNNAIPENCSVFMFVNAPTSVSTPSTVNEITIVSGDWFYGWLPGEVDKTLSEIEIEMNTDGLDVWHISAFNGTARSYTSAGDYSISPRGGFRVHCNVTGAFTI